ncbi:hypothetical protein K438DRAFT_1764843 [Mycena galopus ATCC 62051]|nr:hypothetical protein K438DRAFT_1764843 [Mycena galopus ATCC 62051]
MAGERNGDKDGEHLLRCIPEGRAEWKIRKETRWGGRETKRTKIPSASTRDDKNKGRPDGYIGEIGAGSTWGDGHKRDVKKRALKVQRSSVSEGRTGGVVMIRQETGEQDSTQEKRAHAKERIRCGEIEIDPLAWAGRKWDSSRRRGWRGLGNMTQSRAAWVRQRWQWHGARTESPQEKGKRAQHTNQMNLWAFLGGGWEGQRDVDVFGVLRRELGWDDKYVTRVLLAVLAVGGVKSQRQGKARRRSIRTTE